MTAGWTSLSADMPAAPVIRIEKCRETSDCAVVAISMYLGESYEDVLRAVTVTDRRQGREGLWLRTIQRIAVQLGHKIKVKRSIDWDESYGILRLPEHAVVLRNGLIFDGDGTVWDAEAYLSHNHLNPDDCVLLVAEES